MREKCQGRMRTVSQTFCLTMVMAVVCLALSNCAVISSGLMSHHDELYHAGNFTDLILYMESPTGKPGTLSTEGMVSDRRKQAIFAANLSLIKARKKVNIEYQYYWLSYPQYVYALIESGQLDKAQRMCHMGLQDGTMFLRLFLQQKMEKELYYPQSASFLPRALRKLTMYDGYLVWFQTGDFTKVLPYFDRAEILPLEDKEKLLDHLEKALFYDKMAGDYKKSIAMLNDVLVRADQLGIMDIDSKYAYSLQAYKRLLYMHVKLGQLEEAKKTLESYHQLSGDLLFKTGKVLVGSTEYFRGYLATMDASAGAVFAFLKDFKTSKQYFDDSLKIVSQLNPASAHMWDQKAIGAYYVLYGTYYLALQDRFKEAAECIDRGLHHMKPYYIESIQDEIDIEGAYASSGELYFLLGQYDKALERAKSSIEYSQRYQNKITGARAYTLLGQIYHKKGQMEEAKSAYEEALGLIVNVESTENWKLYYGLSQVYEELGDQVNGLTYGKKAVEEVEKLWQGRFKDTAKQVSFIDNRLVVFEPVIRMLAKQGKSEEAVAYMERSKSRTFFETTVIGTYTAGTSEHQFTASDIKKAVPDKTAIIEYYVGESSVVAAVVHKNRINVTVLPIKVEELNQSVLAFRNVIENVGDGYQNYGADLYMSLIKPLEQNLSGVDRLCIVGHAVLHYLPFQALVVQDPSRKGVSPELLKKEGILLAAAGSGRTKRGFKVVGLTGDPSPSAKQQLDEVQKEIRRQAAASGSSPRPSFLVDRYDVFYAPSIAILNTVHKKGSVNKNNILAMGSPPAVDVRDLGIPGADNLSQLPFAKAEVQRVSDMFTSKELFTDEAATETVAKSQSPKSDLVLFSTHGMLMRREPLKSCLFFNKDDKNDGRLTVEEIEQLQLNSNLIALSACETGLVSGYEGIDDSVYDVKFPHGDDLVGLQRAFLKVGASSVLSTLWSVDDESTSKVIEGFFMRYTKGMDKAASLRDATLALMKESEEMQHPYYWAPFVLSGDWR